MDREQITNWLSANGLRVGKESKTNPKAAEIIKTYKMLESCPGDLCAEAALSIAIEEYVAEKTYKTMRPEKFNRGLAEFNNIVSRFKGEKLTIEQASQIEDAILSIYSNVLFPATHDDRARKRFK